MAWISMNLMTMTMTMTMRMRMILTMTISMMTVAVLVNFHELIPIILNVSRQCLASGEEDVAIIAFEIIDEMIEVPAPLLGESIRAIVQFSLEVCSSSNLESSTRHQAIQIISWLARYKSKSLKKYKLINPILQVMCPLLTEVIDNDQDDDISPDRAAADVVDTILHIVSGALRDPEQVVRGAAAFALGQFAEYLQPEILPHYKRVLPCILRSLQDASDEVKEKSYYALATFCENMDEEILPYIDHLMGKLLAALQNSPRTVQETCMSAIGSVASAVEKAFVPYSERVLELMKTFMLLTKDEDLRSRARATELAGIVAMVAGRERIEPVLPPFIEAAISGYELEYNELRKYTHGFFSNVVEILEDGMVRYLPHVVPLAFSSCNLDDGSAVKIDEYDEEEDIGFGGVPSDDEAQDEPKVLSMSIRTGVLEEKAAATQALGLFAKHTKSAYGPYLEESLKIMVNHSIYFHEDVRLQAVAGLK